MTFRQLIGGAETTLLGGPHPDRARLDAERLLLYLLRKDKAWLLANGDGTPSFDDSGEYAGLIQRRLAGEPIQYITGEAEFFGIPFRITPDVLIPRPETEHLVEAALKLTPPSSQRRILDVGTGSGAIAIAIARNRPSCQITATDLSAGAINLARANAGRAGVDERIRFLRGDLFTPVTGERFDIVVSNPPYVPLRDRNSLSVEVREFEPQSALFAGEDGLDLYRRLIPEAVPFLEPNGWLLLEIGYGQQPAIEELLQTSGYTGVDFIPDYQAIPRVAIARTP